MYLLYFILDVSYIITKRTANNANLLPITSYFAKRVETNAEENNQDCSLASTETLIPSTSAHSATVTSLTPTISVDQDVDVSGLGTLIDGPTQPNLLSYPREQKNRSFRAIWYTSFPWLEYSIAKDKAFCFACRNFSTSTSKSDTAFTKVGFSTWSKAMETNCGFKSHDASSEHLLSMTRWESYSTQKKNPAAGIRNMLDPERPSVVKNNREYMKTLLEYHRYFCSEEIAYRGHDETNESLNAGKWKEFIKTML